MANVATTGTSSSSRALIDAAVAALDRDVDDLLTRTGVPGIAVAVVHENEVLHADGYGFRELGRDDHVTADTVFQLASVSKSIAATVMAALVGRGVIAWENAVRLGLPKFQLADPWVSEHISFADLFAHRSGLPEHAGDLLEDIGYDRLQVIERLRFLPLEPFRVTYAYTNFGLTAAAESAAHRAGMPWEDVSRIHLYEPLGMTSTSSTYADFISQENRATGHVPLEKGTPAWSVTPEQRRPDAQSPAGGVSSSVNDLTKWLCMLLDGGRFPSAGGIDPGALATTQLPQAMTRPPRNSNERPGWYGLGMNVGYDDHGRLTLSHSGGFCLGAGTCFKILPSEKLGIVALTNGAPLGIAEAIVEGFMEEATTGAKSRDWLEFLRPYFEPMVFPEPSKDFDHPPADARPAGPFSLYEGTYTNDFIGDVVVAEDGGRLVATLGPAQMSLPLAHYDGHEFSWQFKGENAGARASVSFGAYGHLPAPSLVLETFAAYGAGHLVRK